jgi:CDP-diacylglycerol--glycerol-3-phosphate 3-phosphatidyltransferase
MRILNRHFIDGFYAVVNPVGEFLEEAEIHPHVVTVLGLILSVVSGILYWKGFIFFAGVILIISGACDVLDGRLARKTNTQSRFGALLDSTVDRYSEIAVYMGLAAFFNSPFIVALIILAIAGSLLTSYARARAEGLGIECKVGIMQRPERITFLAVGSIIGAVFDFVLGTHQALLILAILGIAILSNITVIQRMLVVKNSSLNKNLE